VVAKKNVKTGTYIYICPGKKLIIKLGSGLYETALSKIKDGRTGGRK